VTFQFHATICIAAVLNVNQV